MEFLIEVLEADRGAPGEMHMVTHMTQQIMSHGRTKKERKALDSPSAPVINYMQFEAGLLRLSQSPSAAGVPGANQLPIEIRSLYDRIAELRVSTQHQAGRRIFTHVADFEPSRTGTDWNVSLESTVEKPTNSATTDASIAFSREAAALSMELRRSALRERELLRKDIVNVMGSPWVSTMSIQFEGQSKTHEVKRAIDSVGPGDKVAVYQLKHQADPEHTSRRYKATESHPSNGAEATVMMASQAWGRAWDIGPMRDPLETDFVKERVHPDLHEIGDAGRADSMANSENALPSQEAIYHQVFGMEMILISAPDNWFECFNRDVKFFPHPPN